MCLNLSYILNRDPASEVMAHQTLLTVTCILVLCTTASCSLYDSSASRGLARMKKLAEFTHDQLKQENCLEPNFNVGKRNILDTSEDAVRLEMETKLYNYLLDLLIRCRMDKSQVTSTPTEKPRTTPTDALIPSKTPMNIPTHTQTQMTIAPTCQTTKSPTDMPRPKKIGTTPMDIPTLKELATTPTILVTSTSSDVQTPNKGTAVRMDAPTPKKMTTPMNTPPLTCLFAPTPSTNHQRIQITPSQPTPQQGTTPPREHPLTTSITTPEQAKKPIDLLTRPSTTMLPPTECQNAMSLNESWRLDHEGANIRPNGTSNNDLKIMLQQANPWFRFADGAGDVMLNECVPWQSCGTALPIYTPSAMPSEVGVIKSIRLYAAHTSCGNLYADQGSVMRCSNEPNDFVYRYEGKQMGMSIGFCGMVA